MGHAAAAMLRVAASVLLLAVGAARVARNYPRRAGLEFAVAAGEGAALVAAGLGLLLAPALLRAGRHAWNAVSAEWRQ